ncbi:hypothetical protein [Enterococcus alishanensis]
MTAGIQSVSSIEKSRHYLSSDELNQAKTIVFYKDDCPDCQKVMPKKIFVNFFKRDSVFVNLNNKENRQYIALYNLKEVPTVVTNSD